MASDSILIDNQARGLWSIIGIFAGISLCASLILVLATSNSDARQSEDPFATAKLLFIGGLLGWIVLIAIFHALTHVVLWVRFDRLITYRCLLGVRQLPWTDVARISRIEKRPGQITAVVVRTNGDQFSFTTTRVDCERIVRLSEGYLTSSSRHGILYPWWSSLGVIGAGVLTLLLGAYLDYLWFTGEWTQNIAAVRSSRQRLFLSSLPFITPVLGATFTTIGFIHLRKRMQASRKDTTPANRPLQ